MSGPERFHELFLINEDGWLLRRADGARAGSQQADGYRRVVVDGRKFYEHRVVFAMTHGRQPEAQIDHINGVRNDNRPCNLREATHSQNQRNSRTPITNTSGVKGVCWDAAHSKWRAGLTHEGKTVTVGRYARLQDAASAVAAARARLHGAFANGGAAPPVLGLPGPLS